MILDASPRIGSFVEFTAEGMVLRAYIPRDLPFDPPLQVDPHLQQLLHQAYLVLGRLDGAAAVLPDRERVYYMYLRKEAVLSSQIEGTQSSLEDFLRFEEADPLKTSRSDLYEILNYVKAVELGLVQAGQGRFTLDLLLALHAMLIGGGRGSELEAGVLRTKQNYIGGRQKLMFIPPPPELVSQKMENLLAYVNNTLASAAALIRAAVAHAQFETIHPFMDGNGRLGRMLITLMLCQAGVLHWPHLFLSLYFKQHRSDYYEALNDVREHGDWESWVAFFLRGVIETADVAAMSALAVSSQLQEDRQAVHSLGGSALVVYDHLVRLPITSARQLSEHSGLSGPTVHRALNKLSALGICSEITERQRKRLYRYDKYLDLLNAGTELS